MIMFEGRLVSKINNICMKLKIGRSWMNEFEEKEVKDIGYLFSVEVLIYMLNNIFDDDS